MVGLAYVICDIECTPQQSVEGGAELCEKLSSSMQHTIATR